MTGELPWSECKEMYNITNKIRQGERPILPDKVEEI